VWKKRSLFLIGFLIASLFIFPNSVNVHATELELTAIDDGDYSQQYGWNDGNFLTVRYEPSGAPLYHTYTFVKFNLSSLGDEYEINSVTLSLYLWYKSPDYLKIMIYNATDDWNDASGPPTSIENTSMNVYEDPTCLNCWINWTSTEMKTFIEEERVNDDIVSFTLKWNETVDTKLYFNSTNYGTHGPKLTVDYAGPIQQDLILYYDSGIDYVEVNETIKVNGSTTKFDVNTYANLTAYLNGGYVFKNWTWNPSNTSNPHYLNMTGNFTVWGYSELAENVTVAIEDADFAWGYSTNSSESLCIDGVYTDHNPNGLSSTGSPYGSYDGTDQTNYYGMWVWEADFAWCFADEDSALDDMWHDQSCINCDAEIEESTGATGIGAYNFTISGLQCGKWIFAEERHYNFTGTWFGATNIDTVKIRFNDTAHSATVLYDNVDERWRITEGDEYISMGSGYTSTTDGGNLIVTWPVLIKQSMIDAVDIDFYAWANTTTGLDTGWELIAEDYANLYVLGGLAEYRIVGQSNKIVGGDVWDFNSTRGGLIEANVTYRNLQQLHTLFNWAMDETFFDNNETSSDNVEFGCYVCYEDVWINEWNAQINLYDGHVTDHDYWGVMDIYWYQNGTYVKTDKITTYYEGHNSEDDWLSFYADLWFNKINGSTTFGGRVTPYYYGITDYSNPWLTWIEGKDWGPIHNQSAYHSTFFGDLQDLDGTIISSQDIILMKVWFKLETDASTSDLQQIKNFMPLDFMTTRGRMEGVDTPEWIRPIQPDMPRGGIMDSLWKAIKALGDTLIKALTSIGNFIWDAIGDRFPWFTDFFDTMVDMTVQLAKWVGQLAEWIIGLLSVALDMLSFVTYPIDIIAGTWTLIFDTYNDLFGTSLTTLAVVMFITIFGITMFEAVVMGDWSFIMTLIRTTWAIASTILYWAYTAMSFVVNTVISIIRG
jgi:hypothetical protein